MFDIAAACLVVTALLAYLNHRFVRLPTAIGVMAAALTLSLILVGLNAWDLAPGWRRYGDALVNAIDFSTLLMQGMLSILLFAGALHVDLQALRVRAGPVAALAVLGTFLSTVLVGLTMSWALPWVGVPLPLIDCLLFGALIAPTDPIAVMGILKSAHAPKELELVIVGESLFNDGVGVVIFVLLLATLNSGHAPDATQAMMALLREAGGGLAYGLALGALTLWLLRTVDNYTVEVLLTLAGVTGGYAWAGRLHISGPLAMVVVGLMVGNQGRHSAMSVTTRRYLDVFWEMLDEVLNAVLFVTMGLVIARVPFLPGAGAAVALAIGVTLAVRTVTVGLPVAMASRWFQLPEGSWKVLTWGGLRGGISVALALSLPAGHARDVIVALTYGVVVFSILVQGLTIGPVTRRAMAGAAAP